MAQIGSARFVHSGDSRRSIMSQRVRQTFFLLFLLIWYCYNVRSESQLDANREKTRARMRKLRGTPKVKPRFNKTKCQKKYMNSRNAQLRLQEWELPSRVRSWTSLMNMPSFVIAVPTFGRWGPAHEHMSTVPGLMMEAPMVAACTLSMLNQQQVPKSHVSAIPNLLASGWLRCARPAAD